MLMNYRTMAHFLAWAYIRGCRATVIARLRVLFSCVWMDFEANAPAIIIERSYQYQLFLQIDLITRMYRPFFIYKSLSDISRPVRNAFCPNFLTPLFGYLNRGNLLEQLELSNRIFGKKLGKIVLICSKGTKIFVMMKFLARGFKEFCHVFTFKDTLP